MSNPGGYFLQELEALYRGPQVRLQSPGGSILRMELPVGFSDGVGREQGVLLAVRHHLTDAWCVYLTVYDDVRDVCIPCGPNSLAMDCASAL